MLKKDRLSQKDILIFNIKNTLKKNPANTNIPIFLTSLTFLKTQINGIRIIITKI